MDALLVKAPKRVILIDTGVGGALQQSLAQAGTKPEEVTDILITHSHPDHMGGLVKDGKLAFPKATIRMSSAEWAFAKKNAQLANIVKVIDRNVKTLQAGRGENPAGSGRAFGD
ncbi:MBL fold metallo-hydrolase [Rhizobium sp. 768_B6_N1_8]|uniref:MBL fold metallo-hydrolase n=1 Tax=unclassified Rhizobium TaxID=2613769 RepID=UPI003F260D66